MNLQAVLAIIVMVFFIAFVVTYMITTFVKSPTNEQKEKVRNWLLVAVTEAEKIYGGKTGQIKLSYVYDLFIQRFPDISYLFTLNMFSSLVDEVLAQFRRIIESNAAVQKYIENS